VVRDRTHRVHRKTYNEINFRQTYWLCLEENAVLLEFVRNCFHVPLNISAEAIRTYILEASNPNGSAQDADWSSLVLP
jgi:hypothetical protein